MTRKGSWQHSPMLRALGIRAWHTLQVQYEDVFVNSKLEVALAIWCNSTLGMALHANHSNRSQVGRGMGNKGMLETTNHPRRS